jgi:hypothetical protein
MNAPERNESFTDEKLRSLGKWPPKKLGTNAVQTWLLILCQERDTAIVVPVALAPHS